MSRVIGAVVLAAGAARRYGGQKLLAPVGGRPLVRWTVEQVVASGVQRTVVVLGREAEAVRAALGELPVDFVLNARYAEGMGTSLAAGARALDPSVSAALVVLGDQPISVEIIDRLLRAHRASPHPIVAPSYQGERGNPVLFSASLFAELRRLEGDRGARALLERDPDSVLLVPFPHPPPPDIDTPADHTAHASHLARGLQRTPTSRSYHFTRPGDSMSTDLRGKAAVVTGGSKGIGYAIAEALARAGADLVICARNEQEVGAAAERLDALGGGQVVGLPCDVRSYDEVRELVRRATEQFGRLDILVNNAGVGRFAPVDELSPEQWAQVMQTNLDSVYYACHEAIPHMKEQGGGWIINIGSLAGKNPMPGGAAYNASKFGLVGFSEALMLDVRHHGIRVNYIMPGSVATHFNENTPSEQDAWKIQPEDIAELVMALLAMPERTLPSRIEVRPTRPPRK